MSYGGENGFNQAIELSAEVLSNVKFIQEKKLIGNQHFFFSFLSLLLLLFKLRHRIFHFQESISMKYLKTRQNIALESKTRSKL